MLSFTKPFFYFFSAYIIPLLLKFQNNSSDVIGRNLDNININDIGEVEDNAYILPSNLLIYIIIIIHSKYFPVSDWLKPHAYYSTVDVKMTSKVEPAAYYSTVDRKNLGTRL